MAHDEQHVVLKLTNPMILIPLMSGKVNKKIILHDRGNV